MILYNSTQYRVETAICTVMCACIACKCVRVIMKQHIINIINLLILTYINMVQLNVLHQSTSHLHDEDK